MQRNCTMRMDFYSDSIGTSSEFLFRMSASLENLPEDFSCTTLLAAVKSAINWNRMTTKFLKMVYKIHHPECLHAYLCFLMDLISIWNEGKSCGPVTIPRDSQ